MERLCLDLFQRWSKNRLKGLKALFSHHSPVCCTTMLPCFPPALLSRARWVAQLRPAFFPCDYTASTIHVFIIPCVEANWIYLLASGYTLKVKWNRCQIIGAELPSNIRTAFLTGWRLFFTLTLGWRYGGQETGKILSEIKLMQFCFSCSWTTAVQVLCSNQQSTVWGPSEK